MKTLKFSYFSNNTFDIELKQEYTEGKETTINPFNLSENPFEINKPLTLKDSKIYAFSNNFIFNEDKRCFFGGKLFKDILFKYNKIFCFFDEEGIIQLNEDAKEKENNFIRELFSLMENKEKLENSPSEEEFLKILETDENFIYNELIEKHLISSIFLEETYKGLHIGMATRNSIALILDNENKLKVFEYEDILKQNKNNEISLMERNFENVKEFNFDFN